MSKGKRIAVVSVINDLVTDSRVLRTAGVLKECGYEPFLIGRELATSLPLSSISYRSHRMKLMINKGPAFYLYFQVRLFLKLLFTKADLLLANDLDTLLPNYLVSRIRSIPLIYDSHEIFCEVPELKSSPFKKKIWETLEKFLVPRCGNLITVNESIARYFTDKYHVTFRAVRNIPSEIKVENPRSRAQLGLPEGKKIVLMQGAGINIDRGAEELVDSMRYTSDDVFLIIIGGGDVWPSLKLKTGGEMKEKVLLIDKLPKQELYHYTLAADIGVTIDKDSNLNYRYSLPNKIFDYLQAGLPVLASRLPEVARIISEYRCGIFIEDHSPRHIASAIEKILEPAVWKECRVNAQLAARELNWEKERIILKNVILEASRHHQVIINS